MAGRHLCLGVASGRPVKPHYALPRPVRLYGYVSLHAMIARLVLPRHRCDGIAHVPHPSHIQPSHVITLAFALMENNNIQYRQGYRVGGITLQPSICCCLLPELHHEIER